MRAPRAWLGFFAAVVALPAIAAPAHAGSNRVPTAYCWNNEGCMYIDITNRVGELFNRTASDSLIDGLWTTDGAPPATIGANREAVMYADATAGFFRPERINGYIRYSDATFNGITLNFFWQDDKVNQVSYGCDYACTVLWNPHNNDPPPAPSRYCRNDPADYCQRSLRIRVTIAPRGSASHPVLSHAARHTRGGLLRSGLPFTVRAPTGGTLDAHAVLDRRAARPIVVGRLVATAERRGRRYTLRLNATGRRLVRAGERALELHVAVKGKDGVVRTDMGRIRVG